MKTPMEHLAVSEALLARADIVLAAQVHPSAEQVTALAVAHISLALAINAVPLVSDLRDEMRDTRDPYRDVIKDAVARINRELP